MADYKVLADTSKTLVEFFRSNMVPDLIGSKDQIGMAAPSERGNLTLSLFLYRVLPDGMTQQMNWMDGGNRLQFPPMALNLYYLLTVQSGAELSSRGWDEQVILGRAIQLLYDNAMLPASALQGTLSANQEELRLEVNEQPPMETLTHLMQGQTFRLSFGFMAGPVFIDSERSKSTTRVTGR